MMKRWNLVVAAVFSLSACGSDPATGVGTLDDKNAAVADLTCDCFAELAYATRAECDASLRATADELACVNDVAAQYGDVISPTIDCAIMLAQETVDCFNALSGCADATAVANCDNIISSGWENCPVPTDSAAAIALDACGSRLIPD